MKRIILLLFSMAVAATVCGQSLPDYPGRLFYTCKVWGFVKYFHSETANCTVNLDSALLQALPQIEAATTTDAFNQALLTLINSPGPPALPTVPMPVVPDSLMYNLDLSWFQDPVFTQQVRGALDTIRVRFRPRPHCLVGEAFVNGNPTFDNDILYNSGSGQFPTEPLRILSLFRYWNILNYFFPYKNIMDQPWDTTLAEVIPLFLGAQNAVAYDKAVMLLAKRIDDSHAFLNGGVVNSILGSYYPRFSIAMVEGETVVTKVSSSVNVIAPGDIIRTIDGVDIGILHDSLEAFTHGSNPPAVASYVLDDILRGPYGSFPVTVENQAGIHPAVLQRDWSASQFSVFEQNTTPVWYDTVAAGGCTFGYVDMGRLTTSQTGAMMNDLWETDAIIFDIRNYPQGTLWYLVNYLFPQPFQIAAFTTPDIDYPGVLFWKNVNVGSYSPEVYQGQLIILFDIRTISQAEYTVMGLEQHPGAIKIGNQTKAADGNVSVISLPGNLSANFTGLGTFYPDYTPTQRVGIVPDIEVWPTIAGIRQGRDEILETAMNCNLLSAGNEARKPVVLSLFPNPSDGAVTVSFSIPGMQAATLEVRDMTGKPVYWRALTAADLACRSCVITPSEWPAGIYVCLLKTGGNVYCTKLIRLR
ncbi:MAG: T9SS type A sorting domain-containing protein [Alphaproteobacteria bacterium]|nr:T9SS type A sorting domain-containing protein [Alphaproteobacteria bacterium]